MVFLFIFESLTTMLTLFQVCDDAWHHYAVSVSAQGVQLTLDGELWQVVRDHKVLMVGIVLLLLRVLSMVQSFDYLISQAEKENPEVIDDWPLHPAADIKTTLSVGACWHGQHHHRHQRHRPHDQHHRRHHCHQPGC